jgi:hypothetical protein
VIRALTLCIPMLAIGGAAIADDAATLTAAVVDATKAPSKQAAASEASRDKDSQAQNEAGAKPAGDVQMSGMSVLGNDEAPKSLVLVPWKSSQLGDAPGLSKMLDDSTQPVDKDVFMRELGYYQIKTGEMKAGEIDIDSK